MQGREKEEQRARERQGERERGSLLRAVRGGGGSRVSFLEASCKQASKRWEPPLSIALAKEGRETDGVLLPLVLPDEEVTLMEFAVLANRSAPGGGADVRG